MNLRRILPAVLPVLSAVLAPPLRSQTLSDKGTAERVASILGDARLPSLSYDSSRLPSQVRVVTSAEIEAMGARTVQEVLERLPGVVTFDEVGDRWQQTIDLRGFNGNPVPATVVIVDGARVNEPDFGAVNFQAISPSDIARIEVRPGPQTLLGRGAMAGVVEIVTKQAGRRPRVEAGVEAGSFGYRKLQASLERAAGAWGYRLSGSRASELGWRSHSAARLNTFDGRLDRVDAGGQLSLAYQFGDDRLQQAGSLTSSEISQDRRQNVSRVDFDSLVHRVTLNGRRALGGGLAAAFNAYSRYRLENTPLNLGRTSISASRAAKQSEGAALQLEHAAEVAGRRSLLAAGAELSYDKSDSDSSGSFGGFAFRSGSLLRQRGLGLFAQETFDLWPQVVVLTAGARWDRAGLENQDKTTPSNDGSRVYTRASPRVALDVNPAPWLQAFASLAESFRAPTAQEISALGPFSSSPQLKPVKARTAELGWRAFAGRWGQATLSLYRTMTQDEIFPVFDPTAGFGQNRNIPRVRRDGLELTLDPRWGETLDARLAYAYTQATFQTGFTLDKAPFPATQIVSPGDFLPLVPRHRLFVEARVHPAPGWSVSLNELCLGSRFLLGDESNTERRLGAYCLLGAGARLERGALSLFVKAENLLDRRYETRGILGTSPTTSGLERFLMPASGVCVSGGASVRFELRSGA